MSCLWPYLSAVYGLCPAVSLLDWEGPVAGPDHAFAKCGLGRPFNMHEWYLAMGNELYLNDTILEKLIRRASLKVRVYRAASRT